MREIGVNKKDVVWSYLAQFLSMGVGLITLPFVLNRLTADEIGLNYILITIGSIVALVDLGFAPQFARNFTYVFSGAQELKKEGIGRTDEKTNFKLLKDILNAARCIYGVLALISVALLLGVGTPYVHHVTKGFTAVGNCLAIWVVYSFGILFQVYYSYYSSMLIGAGLIKEQKYTVIVNKTIYMAITIGCLYGGMGLMSVALAQLVSPFAGRWLSYRYFYTAELRAELGRHAAGGRDVVWDIFKTLWYNAKRTAVMSIGAYAILRLSMFIAGLYLTLQEFASYGLMTQLVQLLGTVSCTYMTVSQPKFAALRTKGDTRRLLASFSNALKVFYLLFIPGSIVLVLWGEPILGLIRSNASLPSQTILAVYCVVMLLENNHANFSTLISANNHIPFAPASIITGTAVCIGIFVVVKYTTLGILGLVLVQGICQAAYQNWKWPYAALHEYGTDYWTLLRMGRGFDSLIKRWK